jgi:ribose 1,5-bisphosphokinase
MTGAFVGIAGPSGAGKDSVIEYARTALEGDARFVFARRVITRPPGPAEDSAHADEAEFARRAARGDFVLSWRAHGLAYGIPAETVAQVRGGTVVVGNLSRSVLGELPACFPRSFAVRVTVPEHVRRARIAARGREDDAAARARLERPDPAPDVPVDLEIVNDRGLAEAGDALVAFLRGLARPDGPAGHGEAGRENG